MMGHIRLVYVCTNVMGFEGIGKFLEEINKMVGAPLSIFPNNCFAEVKVKLFLPYSFLIFCLHLYYHFT